MDKLNFKIYFEESDNNDLKKLLSKIPKSHKNLVKDFKFTYTKNNTLNGDKKHIGVIYKDKIEIAAPWNYSREFTTLHEIAHMVWAYKMSSKLKNEWKKISKKTLKDNKNINEKDPEELFCMAYAQYYAKNKITKFDHPEWEKFIKQLSN